MPGMLILYDGVCNLCNHAVQTVLRNDRRKKFRFAALQGEIAKQLLQQYHLPVQKNDSFVLIDNGRVYERSSAALKVAKNLDGLWPLLYIFIIVPSFIRDAVYNLIAKNRYKWFGRNDNCLLPSPDYKERFID